MDRTIKTSIDLKKSSTNKKFRRQSIKKAKFVISGLEKANLAILIYPCGKHSATGQTNAMAVNHRRGGKVEGRAGGFDFLKFCLIFAPGVSIILFYI